MAMLKRILLTPGEPAGIGPDIVVQAAQLNWQAELVAVADSDLLSSRAKALKLPLKLHTVDINNPPQEHTPGTLGIIPIQLATPAKAKALQPEHAAYVLKTLHTAAELCLQKHANAIVTGPVHKGIINQAGFQFSGHTEFFADVAKVKQTVMLFVTPVCKVALATTHLPLAKVPKAITKELLQSTLGILKQGFNDLFQQANPHIFVCGLNPHAGENGYLGHEEIDVITPALDELRAQGYHLTGPLPADTIFTKKYLSQADAIFAMYHDQALPVVKYLGFGQAVNVTLGLPFIRTSVDHGTALDVAGTKLADPASINAAITLAIELAMRNKHEI